MHLDHNNLPMQADGDKEDQLHRSGMILTAMALGSKKHAWVQILVRQNWVKLMNSRGVYKRHFDGDPKNVSGDQLIPMFCFLTKSAGGNRTHRVYLKDLYKSLFLRLGFAQNFLTLEGRPKIPDFLLLRVLPLMPRIHPIAYPVSLVLDLLLIPMVLSLLLPVWRDDSVFPVKRTQDDVDHNNLILTLLLCRKYFPTPVSFFAYWLLFKICPINYGVTKLGASDNVSGSLMWYHRKESGGNPEVAEMVIDLL